MDATVSERRRPEGTNRKFVTVGGSSSLKIGFKIIEPLSMSKGRYNLTINVELNNGMSADRIGRKSAQGCARKRMKTGWKELPGGQREEPFDSRRG